VSIWRRETKAGVRYDVQWRLPDRSKRKKTFSSERAAKQFEAKLVTSSATGESVDPRGGRTELESVYRSWIASRPDLSAKVRRGYEDNRRLRIQPRFRNWAIAKIDHESIQRWVNEMSASGLSPRTVRWTHTVLKMTLDYAVDDGRLIAKNPATRTKFPPMRRTTHIYLTAREVAELTDACGSQGDVVAILAYTGLRFGELTGLNVEGVDVAARRIRVRRSITQVGGRLVEGNPKSDAGRRSVPIPERLVPAEGSTRWAPAGCSGNCLTTRLATCSGELEAGSQLADWRSPRSGEKGCACTIWPHTYASLSRRAGADLRLFTKSHGARVHHGHCPHVRRPFR